MEKLMDKELIMGYAKQGLDALDAAYPQAYGFVPKHAWLTPLFAGAALLGVPMVLKVLVQRGGPPRSRLAALLGLLLAGGLAYLTLQKGNSLFAWHVIGMSGAVLGLQPAAVHAILSKKSFHEPSIRASRAHDHKILQGAVMCGVLGGFLAIFLNKPWAFPGKHFMSAHSLMGLAALALMGFNTLHGGARSGSPLDPNLHWVSTLHRVVGTCGFCLAISACLLGLYNRTVVVDWEVRPIAFSLPPTWKEMGGWGLTNLGADITKAFMGGILVLWGLLLLPGKAALVSRGKKE